MNEHRKKSGERRHSYTINEKAYQDDNYGHPNHYEDSSEDFNNHYLSSHQYASISEDNLHRKLNLNSDPHHIDYTTDSSKSKKNNSSDDDYEYLYYYYYDYVYPDDAILQNLGENGEFLDYDPQQRARDLSASQRNNNDYYEMLPKPMASNGTVVTTNNSTSELTNLMKPIPVTNSTALEYSLDGASDIDKNVIKVKSTTNEQVPIAKDTKKDT